MSRRIAPATPPQSDPLSTARGILSFRPSGGGSQWDIQGAFNMISRQLERHALEKEKKKQEEEAEEMAARMGAANKYGGWVGNFTPLPYRDPWSKG